MPSINLLPEDFTVDFYKRKEKVAVFSLSIFFLVASILFYMDSELKRSESKGSLAVINEDIAAIDQEINEQIQGNEIFSSEFDRNDIEKALSEHFYFSAVLDFLKEHTIRNVALQEIDLFYNEEGSLILDVIGESKNYDSAISQIAFLKDSYWTEGVDFATLETNEDGYVKMTGSIVLRPEIVVYHDQAWNFGVSFLEDEVDRFIEISKYSASLKESVSDSGREQIDLVVNFSGVCYEKSKLDDFEARLKEKSFVKKISINEESVPSAKLGSINFNGEMVLEY